MHQPALKPYKELCVLSDKLEEADYFPNVKINFNTVLNKIYRKNNNKIYVQESMFLCMNLRSEKFT